MNKKIVRDAATGERLDGIPTATLIGMSAGSRDGIVEAYVTRSGNWWPASVGPAVLKGREVVRVIVEDEEKQQ